MNAKAETIVPKILTYLEKIAGYSAPYETYENFAANSLVVDACVFNLSQIGELVAPLEKSFRDARPQIPWAQIYHLRNRIVHDYEGVNITLIWQIIHDDLPTLQ
jgi:uncharacterized protein with HEPN domain